MPKLIVFILITVMLLPLLTHGANVGLGIDWKRLNHEWQNYIKNPSSENAKKVYSILPTEGKVRTTEDPQGQSVLESIERNLDVLKTQIASVDRDAIRLAFRLFTISDGSLSEDLDVALGTLIRIDPRAFLQELRDHRKLVVRLDALVGNFGPDYVDKTEAREREKSLRIKAFESVTDPSLSNLREQCLSALKQ